MIFEALTLKLLDLIWWTWLDCDWQQEETFSPLRSWKSCDVIQFRHKNRFFSEKSPKITFGLTLHVFSFATLTWWKSTIFEIGVSDTCGRVTWRMRIFESFLDINQAGQEPKKIKNTAFFYRYETQPTPITTKINKDVILLFLGQIYIKWSKLASNFPF